MFDKDKYKVWKLPHPILLHWIINPGLAFNELILGQRIPKVTLIDKNRDLPLIERQSVPCPHCNTLNDGRLWTGNNAFGHWFGLICPQCFKKIPCLWNITSLVLLALTFPIWIWIKKYGEKHWIEKEKQRFSSVLAKELPKAKKTSWLGMGISFGIIMFCLMVLPGVFRNEFSYGEILVQAAIWLCGGLVFGFLMKLFLSSKK